MKGIKMYLAVRVLNFLVTGCVHGSKMANDKHCSVSGICNLMSERYKRFISLLIGAYNWDDLKLLVPFGVCWFFLYSSSFSESNSWRFWFFISKSPIKVFYSSKKLYSGASPMLITQGIAIGRFILIFWSHSTKFCVKSPEKLKR